MSSETINLRTLGGEDVGIDPDVWDPIPEKSRLLPGDPGFEDATRIWNGMINKQPGLVIQPESIDEAAAAVNLARQQCLLFSIKGGGHNVAGLSLADRGVTLDMSRMRDVRALPSCSKPEGEQLDVGPFHLKQPQVVCGAPDQPLTQCR